MKYIIILALTLLASCGKASGGSDLAKELLDTDGGAYLGVELPLDVSLCEDSSATDK